MKFINWFRKASDKVAKWILSDWWKTFVFMILMFIVFAVIQSTLQNISWLMWTLSVAQAFLAALFATGAMREVKRQQNEGNES